MAAVLAAAVAVLAAVVVVVVLRGDGSNPARRAENADRPVHPTANPAPARGKSGPNLAVNPADENHIVELHQELVTSECEVNVSFDRGRTWTATTLPPPAGRPVAPPGPCPVTGLTIGNVGQQSLAFGSGGNVYVSWSTSPDPNVAGSTVHLSRSTDGGVSFGPPSAIPRMVGGVPPEPDFTRPELVVDRRPPANDRIYVTARNARLSQVLVVRSDDGGSTWTPPAEASASNPVRNPPPTFAGSVVTGPGDAYTLPTEVTQPVLGPVPPGGGERPLHVGWLAASRGPACPPSCEAIGETAADGYLVVATSTDAGQTWTRTRAVNVRGHVAPSGTVFRGSAFPRMAGGLDGSLYTVFIQGPGTPPSANCGTGPFPAGLPGSSARPCPAYQGTEFRAADHSISYDADVWFLRSHDGGATWDGLRRVNDPARPGLAVPEITQTRHPQVSVAAGGGIDIVWEDRRHWYLPPSARRAAVTPSGPSLAGYPCVHTHTACDEARLGDTYHVRSTDRGATFSPNRRLNDRSHNNDVGFDYRRSTYRDYGPAAVAIEERSLLVADMDSRLGNHATNSLDIFVREVDLAPRTPAVDHLGGGDPASLSVDLARLTEPGGGEAVLSGEATTRPMSSVVIVNEDDPAAALVGGVLARAGLGVLLASPAEGLPTTVKAEIDRLDPVRVHILGDSRKLSLQVQADVAGAGVPTDRISRISGVTPVDVAAAVARALDGRSAAEKAATPPLPAFDAAIIVNPTSSSGTSAAALAANRRLPVLYVDQGAVPAATRSALNDLGIARTLVVGTTSDIDPSVEAVLPAPIRLGGDDPGAASASVVRESLARGLPANIVYLVDADEPMHAALVGAAAGRLGGLLVAVPGGDADGVTAILRRLQLEGVTTRIVTSDA